MTEHLRLNKAVDVMMSRHVMNIRKYIMNYLFRGNKFLGEIYSKDIMYIVPQHYRYVVDEYLRSVVSTMCVEAYEYAVSVSMLEDIIDHEMDQRMIEEDDHLFEQAGFRMAYVLVNMVISVCNAIELYESVQVTKIRNLNCRNATVDILYVMFAAKDEVVVDCYLNDDNLLWREYIVCNDVHFPDAGSSDAVIFSMYDYVPKVQSNAVVISQYYFEGAYKLGCGYIHVDISPVQKPIVKEAERIDVSVDEIVGHYGDLEQVLCELSCDTVVIADDPCIGVVEKYPETRLGDVKDIKDTDKAVVIYHLLSTSLLDTLTSYLAKHEYSVTVYIVEACVSERLAQSRGTLRKELDRIFLESKHIKRDDTRILLIDVMKWCVDNGIVNHGRDLLRYHDYYDGWIYWFKPRYDEYTLCVGTGSMVIQDDKFMVKIRGMLSWVRCRYHMSCDEWMNVTSPVAGNYSYKTFEKALEDAATKIFNSDVEYGLTFFSPVDDEDGVK